jgi:glutamine synthetase
MTNEDQLARDLPGWISQIETVSLCVPDGVGRLVGKRVDARGLAAAVDDGLAMPDFHLTTDLENVALSGLRVTGPHTGFPNGVLQPDLATLRRLPWDPSSALVMCEALHHDGTAVDEAPRAILRNQVERLHSRGLQAVVATELEFYVYAEPYREAATRDYAALTPLYHRQGDHDVLVTGFLDRFLGPVRRAMAELGVPAVSTLGEGGIGQAEMNFGHGEPMTTADNHVLFKHAAKALAQQHGVAATFLAKVDESAPGSGCHIHLSLWDHDGSEPQTARADSPGELSERARAFLAGILAHTPELTVLHAPYANSYARLQPDSWAPSGTPTWGYDNRTVLVRLLGTGPTLHFEFRLPGADVNPYVSIAALLAAGIAGLDRGLPLQEPFVGDAGTLDRPMTQGRPLPCDLGAAVLAFESSTFAEKAFGPEVHEHLAARARAELAATTRAVTDWGRRRGFEGA